VITHDLIYLGELKIEKAAVIII